MQYRFLSFVKTGCTKMVNRTSVATILIRKRTTNRNKLILAPVLVGLSFLNQLSFNIGFRFGERIVFRLYRNNLGTEVDKLPLKLKDYPVYLNLLRSLIDPLKELYGSACSGKSGGDFRKGHGRLNSVSNDLDMTGPSRK